MEITEKLIPFKYDKDIMKHIPKLFINEEDDSINYSWFTNAPRYTTFRLNVNKYKYQEVIGDIKQQLLKEAEIRNTKPPNIFMHKIINDCIVISNWQDKSEINLCGYEVIIDVPCANAVLRGADIFAPGILSLSSNAKIGDKVAILADIYGKCKRGFNKTFTGKTLFIGTGIVKITRNELFKNNAAARGIGVEVYRNISGIPRLKFSEDMGLLQNFPSIVCGHLFHNITGKILDMCASPGNKTTHIATILRGKGEVIALDKTPEKVSRIGKHCERFGLTNVRYYVYDSTKCIRESEADSNSYEPPFIKESFSAVLLDPPCSGLGQRPALMNNISPLQLKSYTFLQRQLFRSASN